MLSVSALQSACCRSESVSSSNESDFFVREQKNEDAYLTELSTIFASQGVQWEPKARVLWCLLCTSHRISFSFETKDRDDSFSPSSQLLVRVGSSKSDVLKHCSTREHLLRFEEGNDSPPMDHGLPVEIHGQQMLLLNHCLYPSSCFGAGKVIIDESLSERSILGQDACGGVKLLPYHRYSVAELILPQFVSSTALNSSQICVFPTARNGKYKEAEVARMRNESQLSARRSLNKTAVKERAKGARLTTQEMLEMTNRNIERKRSFWLKSDLLSNI